MTLRAEIERLRQEIVVAYCAAGAAAGKMCDPCCCDARKATLGQSEDKAK